MNERTEDIKERFAKVAYEYAVVAAHQMAMEELDPGDRLPTSRYREWKKIWDGLSGEQKSFVSSLIFDVASSSAHGFASILEGSLVELE